ncbi:DNA-protecting protein DprA, partial [Streptomyces sp. SID3343]|nr:DNA-protecting protein DprA [Streptomyces sp. SID3343]
MTGPGELPWAEPTPVERDAAEDRRARAALCRLVEPGDALFGLAVRNHGAARLLRDLRGHGSLP